MSLKLKDLYMGKFSKCLLVSIAGFDSRGRGRPNPRVKFYRARPSLTSHGSPLRVVPGPFFPGPIFL